jgi:glycosyltransferase involved in cell wall biosynthesis
LKILQLIQKPQLRGAELFASQLSNHLNEAGHEVRIISLLPGTAELPFKGEVIKFNRQSLLRLFDVDGWKKLNDYIRNFKPDVVQANAGDTLKFAVLSKLIFRWKTPIVFRNANLVSDFVNSRAKRVFNKFLMSNVRYVISVSELCRLDLIKTYNFDQHRTIAIPIGVESTNERYVLPKDVKGFFESARVLVNVASLVPEKNHQGLLQIVKRIVSRYSDVKVLIIGDGKLRGMLAEQITQMDLTENVFLLGYRSDVLNILAHAKAMVLPSNIEGLPGAILEAFACKIPVVAYNVGGISEVITHRQTGWLVEKSNEQSFIESIDELLNNDSLVQSVTENAYKLVNDKFKNIRLAKAFAGVYEIVAQTN